MRAVGKCKESQRAGWVLFVIADAVLHSLGALMRRGRSPTPPEPRRKRDVYAVFERSHGKIAFAGRIAAGYRGQWREGVALAPLPRDLDAWPAGYGWPDRMVGVSVADASLYRVFTYASDLEGSGFQSTGMAFGGVFETFPGLMK